jgi:membrane protein
LLLTNPTPHGGLEHERKHDMGTTRPLALRANRLRLERGARLVHRFARGLMAHDAFGAAASTAFWIFLSLVPLLVIVGFLVGQVARARGVDVLVEPILEVVPGTAEGLVGKELQRLAGGSASSLAPLGVAGFLWTASAGIHNLMDVLETAANARRRAWWKQRVIALGWVVVGLATACSLAWVLVQTDALINAYDPAPSAAMSAAPRSPPAASSHAVDRARETRAPAAAPRARGSLRRRVARALQAPLEKLIAAGSLLAAGAGLLAGFYRYAVEHPRGVRRRVWPGVTAAIFSWLIVSWVFGDYVSSIADYALYYGGLAAVAVLLVWLYLTSLALVIGAEVNVQLEGLRDEG